MQETPLQQPCHPLPGLPMSHLVLHSADRPWTRFRYTPVIKIIANPVPAWRFGLCRKHLSKLHQRRSVVLLFRQLDWGENGLFQWVCLFCFLSFTVWNKINYPISPQFPELNVHPTHLLFQPQIPSLTYREKRKQEKSIVRPIFLLKVSVTLYTIHKPVLLHLTSPSYLIVTLVFVCQWL